MNKEKSKRYLIKPFNSKYNAKVDLECNGENDATRISNFIIETGGDSVFIFLPGTFLFKKSCSIKKIKKSVLLIGKSVEDNSVNATYFVLFKHYNVVKYPDDPNIRVGFSGIIYIDINDYILLLEK